MTLAGDASACKSTVDELIAAVRTRHEYSSNPVLTSAVGQLVSVSNRWLDECPHDVMNFTVDRLEHLNSILHVADLIFGHSGHILSQSASFYKYRNCSISYSSVICIVRNEVIVTSGVTSYLPSSLQE